MNSPYFRDELVAMVQSGRGRGLGELAKLDWSSAKPIIEKLANGNDTDQKISALTVSRDHALELKDSAQAEADLAKLKLIVANNQLYPYQRSNVIRYIMESKWEGRIDWFLTLLRDPILSGLEPPLALRPQLKRRQADAEKVTDALNEVGKIVKKQFGENGLVRTLTSDQEEIISKVIELVGNPDPQLHNAAVSYLAASIPMVGGIRFSPGLEPKIKLEETNIYYKATQALLPWLTNKN